MVATVEVELDMWLLLLSTEKRKVENAEAGI